MSTTICFDFGNTRLKAGVFADSVFREEVVLSGPEPDAILPLLEKEHPDKIILSSVINHPPETIRLLEQFSRFHLLNHASKLPLTTPVGKPETIGADRLAICAAAVDLFPNNHCLAIGLGTCITYNFINQSHEFLGGSISPGMNMRFRAMHEQTALLPMVAPAKRFPLVGIIHAYRSKYNKLEVLITGGDLVFFDALLTHPMHRDPYLLFKGLHAICEANLP